MGEIGEIVVLAAVILIADVMAVVGLGGFLRGRAERHRAYTDEAEALGFESSHTGITVSESDLQLGSTAN